MSHLILVHDDSYEGSDQAVDVELLWTLCQVNGFISMVSDALFQSRDRLNTNQCDLDSSVRLHNVISLHVNAHLHSLHPVPKNSDANLVLHALAIASRAEHSSSDMSRRHPLSIFETPANRKKSRSVKSGEYGWYGAPFSPLDARNSRDAFILCGHPFSAWRINFPVLPVSWPRPRRPFLDLPKCFARVITSVDFGVLQKSGEHMESSSVLFGSDYQSDMTIDCGVWNVSRCTVMECDCHSIRHVLIAL
jgi:hypothetical protein